MDTNSEKQNWKWKLQNSKGYRTAEFFCWIFMWILGKETNLKGKSKIPHGKPEIWYHLMGTMVLDLPRGRIIRLGGNLDVGEEGSEQQDRNPTILTPRNSCENRVSMCNWSLSSWGQNDFWFFLQRMRPIHYIDPRIMFWVDSDQFAIAKEHLQK